MDHLEGATSSDYIEEVEQTLWVCLQCGNQVSRGILETYIVDVNVLKSTVVSFT